MREGGYEGPEALAFMGGLVVAILYGWHTRFAFYGVLAGIGSAESVLSTAVDGVRECGGRAFHLDAQGRARLDARLGEPGGTSQGRGGVAACVQPRPTSPGARLDDTCREARRESRRGAENGRLRPQPEGVSSVRTCQPLRGTGQPGFRRHWRGDSRSRTLKNPAEPGPWWWSTKGRSSPSVTPTDSAKKRQCTVGR